VRQSLRSTIVTLLLAVTAVLAVVGCGRGAPPLERTADSVMTDGMAALASGQFAVAREKLGEALALDEELNRRDRVARELSLLASIAAATAQFDSAITLYGRAVQEYRALALRDSIRTLQIALVRLQVQMGNHREAYARLDEALRLARVFGDSAGVRAIEMELLPLCRRLERWDAENRIVNDLLKVFGGPSEAGRLARVYAEVAHSQAFRGEYDRAAEHFLRSFTLAEQSGDSLLALGSLVRVAVTFDVAGRLTEAFQSYGDALKRSARVAGADRIRLELLLRIGNAYLRAGASDQARQFLTLALGLSARLQDKLLEGYSLAQLGYADLAHDPATALQNFESALSLFEVFGEPRGSAYAALSVAVALDRAGKFTAAAEQYGKAMTGLEGVNSTGERDELRRDCETAFWGGRRTAVYDEALDLLLRTGQTDEAFQVVERRNAWLYYNALEGLELEGADPSLEEILIRYRQARARRIGAERQMAAVLSESPWNRELIGALRGALERSAENLAEAAEAVVRARHALGPFVRPRSARMGDIASRLESGVLLLEYALARRSLHLFAVQKTRTSVQVAAVEREKVVAAVGDLERHCRAVEATGDSVSTITPPPNPDVQRLLATLYEMFVRPVEQEIRTVRRVLVVLPPELAALPLHALRKGSSQGAPYLAEQVAVRYLPGAAWMDEQAPVLTTVRDVAGVGYAGRTAWDVEYELRDIRAFFKEARLSFGSQASFTTILREKADLLHLALEVRYNPAAPGNAAMVLSDSKSADLNVPVSLGRFLFVPPAGALVLSNLAPGSGQTQSLVAPVLLSAGTGRVIVTTHTPSRKAKKVFSELFYTALLGGADVESALRTVQSEMIRNREFSSPLVWGTYRVWGR